MACLTQLSSESPRERIYEITGLQFLPFNTVYQLLALKLIALTTARSGRDIAHDAGSLCWLLTGRRAGERTDASTTQLLNPRTGTWSDELCQELETATHNFTRLD